MAYSFANVGAIRRQQPKRKSRQQAIAKSDAPTAILTLAKIIDPSAWSDPPQPSIAELKRQVARLTEDVEWLSNVPTTPEGEYQRILAEQRQQQALVLAGRL